MKKAGQDYAEINIQGPFQQALASKYPFDTGSKMEAGPAEIAKVFGPDGSIARFTNDTLTPLIVRRGDAIAPRTWAEIGLRLRPEFVAAFANWVAPLEGGAAPAQSGTGSLAAPSSQTVFQILPQGAPGLLEYTIEIDGQRLRYRNTAPAWEQFVWPNAVGSPGARITAITNDGHSVDVLNEQGRFALTKMLETARRRPLQDNLFELSWANGATVVAVHLRIVSQPGASPPLAGGAGAPVAASGLHGARLPPLVAGAESQASTSSQIAGIAK